MDEAIKDTIMAKAKQSLNRIVWGFTIGAGIFALIGGILLIVAFTQNEEDQFTFQLTGGMLLGMGLLFILIWIFVGFHQKRHQEMIIDRVFSSQNILTQFIYNPNEDFREYIHSEYGWTGRGMKRIIGLSILFFVIGIFFTGKFPFIFD
jgi:hypothetical protein